MVEACRVGFIWETQNNATSCLQSKFARELHSIQPGTLRLPYALHNRHFALTTVGVFWQFTLLALRLLRAARAVSDRPWSASERPLASPDRLAAFTKPNFHPEGVLWLMRSAAAFSSTPSEREREFNKDFSNSIEETNKKVCYKAVEF